VIEAAISILALQRGLLPPTHNLEDPDPDTDVDHILKVPRAVRPQAVLSNSFGFGGHNVSLVLANPGPGDPAPGNPGPGDPGGNG
jgi:3-oxoacyl-[acyl-carrier-protein] synthase II